MRTCNVATVGVGGLALESPLFARSRPISFLHSSSHLCVKLLPRQSTKARNAIEHIFSPTNTHTPT